MISQNSNTFLQLCKSECESKEILSEILCGKHTRKSSSILVVSFDVHILTHNALISILCQIDSRCEWEIQCSFYTCNCDFFFFAKWNKQERFKILLLHINANNKKKKDFWCYRNIEKTKSTECCAANEYYSVVVSKSNVTSQWITFFSQALCDITVWKNKNYRSSKKCKIASV